MRRPATSGLVPLRGVAVLGAGVLGVAVLGTGLVRIARARLLVVRVHGDSMRPTLLDGSRVLVLRRSAHRVPPGSVVVGRFPSRIRVDAAGFGDWFYVKRLVARGPGEATVRRSEISSLPAATAAGGRLDDDVVRWTLDGTDLFVRGDHPSSADSISWGPVPASELVGMVVARLPASTAPGST